MFRKATVATIFSFFALGVSGSALAQAYPEHPIKVILPFPAGGGTDVLLRIVTREMSKTLGQPIIVMNRPGAGGKIGMNAAKQEKPDGYTMVVSSTSTMAVYPVIDAKLTYDPIKDFTQIGVMAITPGVLVANKDFPADSIKDTNKLLLADPAKYIIASGTPTTYLATELYKQMLGANVEVISYSGSPPIMLDLIPGRVHLTFMIAGAAIPDIKKGTVKPIAVTWKEPMTQLPGVGTMQEVGMGDVDASTWLALAFPKGVSEDKVKKVNAAMNQALKDPSVIEQLEALGFFVEGGSPEWADKRVEDGLARWSKVYKDAGSPPLM